MGRERQFHDALFAQPAPPCDEFACVHARRCKRDQLACESFFVYVHLGVVHRNFSEPTRAYYRALFVDASGKLLRLADNRVVTPKP